MDQLKIGKFIAARRKQGNLTQLQLAEKLGITDRAVSKWETGKAMPDSSIMLELCDTLQITVNDLLSGEIVTMDNYNKELEHNLLEMIEQKERSDKRLLTLEIVLGVVCILPLAAAILVGLTVPMKESTAAIVILAGLIPLLVATPFALRIEQTAGYYECAKCGHRYVPAYKNVFAAMHMGRSRYMRCPNCSKRSWQKKKLRKD